MSTQITTSFVQQYRSGVELLVQQKGSRLRDAVRMETGVHAKNAYFDQIGITAAVPRLARHADTPQIDTPHARRRVTLVDYEWADLVDDQDKVRTLNEFTSPYQEGAAAASSVDESRGRNPAVTVPPRRIFSIFIGSFSNGSRQHEKRIGHQCRCEPPGAQRSPDRGRQGEMPARDRGAGRLGQ